MAGKRELHFIPVVSAVQCQLLPPGGRLGKNPLFYISKPDVSSALSRRQNIFSIYVVEQQKEYFFEVTEDSFLQQWLIRYNNIGYHIQLLGPSK